MDDLNDEPADAPDLYPDRERDARWVESARSGDPDAFGRLYDNWFDRCFDVARRIVRSDEAAADVAQEAFVSAWRNLDGLADPRAFGGWILRITRNQAFNTQTKDQRSTPVDDEGMAVITGGRVPGTGGTGPAGFGVEDRLGTIDDPARVAEDNELVALLWGAAESLGERDAEVLNLQLRHGLSPAEVGEVLGMNRNAANQLVHRVRGRLEGAVRARVLWRHGEPVCERLAAELDGAGIKTFDADAASLINRHAKACEACGERERTKVAPGALFAAVPIAAPIMLKEQAAAALMAEGVPMAGSAFAPPGAFRAAHPDAPSAGSGDGAGGDGPEGDGGNPDGQDWWASNRTRVLAAAGAAGIVVLVILALLLRGGDDRTTELTAGEETTTTQANEAPGTTVGTTPRRGPTGSAPPAKPMDLGASTTLPPTGAPTPTPSSTVRPNPQTPRSTTTTTAPPPPTNSTTTTTTAPPNVQIQVEVRNSPHATGWINGAPTSPELVWTVTGAEGLAIRIVGPDNNNPDAVLSTDAAGARALCPSAPITDSTCVPSVGTYTYRVFVLQGFAILATGEATLEVVTLIP